MERLALLRSSTAALAFNPTNNSLFVVGHDWDQAVAEISTPALKTGHLSGLNTASVLQPFVRLINKVPDNTLKNGDMLVVGNQLVGTTYEYYDATGNAVDSHFKLNSLNLANATATGLFQVGNLGGGYVAGYMGPIASDDLNRRALVPWQSSAVSDVIFDQLGDHAGGALVSDRTPRRSRAWTPFWPTLRR